MTSLLRLSALRERLRTSLWLWPSVSVVAAIALGLILPAVEGQAGTDALGMAGTPDGARAVLSTVAGSMITVTGLVFSLTVVALQMASSQFTPRLLRTFLADGGNQAVMSTFLGTFAYSLAVLRSIRSPADGSAFVPDVAVTLGLGLTLLSVGMLVYFFHHLTQQLRVESVLAEVQRDTMDLIERTLDPLADAEVQVELDVPDSALGLRVRKSGYLQAVDIDVLIRVAAEEGVSIRLRPSAGINVTLGSTIAWVWPDGNDPAVQLDADALSSRIHTGIQIGPERTLQQDVAFGLRQLVDIAARALSPGINDPTTAAAALHALSNVLASMCSRQLGPIGVGDEQTGVTVVVPRPSFGELLALACDQPRRYGKDEPAILNEMLRLLTDLAEVSTTDVQRDAIRMQIETTLEVAGDAPLSPVEHRMIHGLTRHARAAVERGTRSADLPVEVEEPAS